MSDMWKNVIIQESMGPTLFFQIMGLAFLCSLALALVHRLTNTEYQHKPWFEFVMITVSMITAMIMLAVSTNIALALGLLGSLSVIRMRASIQQPTDIVFVLFSIAIGIGAAALVPWIVIGGTIVLCVTMLLMHLVTFGWHKYPEYSLTFQLKNPSAAEKFKDLAPSLFSKTQLRSTAQIDTKDYHYVYTVRPKSSSPENIIQILQKELEGVSAINLIKPETSIEV